jgi:hypothetical protein
MGLHRAVPALQYLMPEELFATIQRTQVDPNIPTSDADQLPFILLNLVYFILVLRVAHVD